MQRIRGWVTLRRMHLAPAAAAFFADTLLAVHVGIALFVVVMTLAVPVGGPLGWRWIRRRGLRWTHAGLVAVIAVQAWLGRLCPLTTWEQQLRAQAGQATYETSFVGHWLSEWLYLDLPWWSFVLAYTLVAAVVVLGWWRWPPASDAHTRRGSARRSS
ncbi:DUF2784 domain-containing protein [Luteimonas sp BLCC-B24]|uniref:DUF2784 domain-containing protein n=1 Tax=Luteimonas sp. BLCC-B24 TaxID=3025317 RepID=UPI00234CEA7F|nr:DUF2784 domain-containing protein [Luteimonas sp. BLCC-B24]MDC7805943.1 DUF2784 domain-containing protein [Luteimonas sp. BLCC-B24]